MKYLCQRTLLATALLLLLARSGGAQAPLAPKVCEGYNLTIVRRPLGMSLGAAAANTFVVTRLKKERPGVAVGDELLSINGALIQEIGTLKEISAQLKAARLPIILSLRKPTCAEEDDGATDIDATAESPIKDAAPQGVDIVADRKAARRAPASHTAAMHAACPQQAVKKLVVFTALFGSYVKTLKEPVHGCSEHVHHVAYTDRADIFQQATAYEPPSCWHVVLDPDYHLKRDPTNWLHNSIDQHKSNVNIAKFYKMNPHRLPELQGFEYVVWADATARVEAAWPDYFEYLDSKLRPRPNDRLNDQHGPAHPAMLFSHPTEASNQRDGRLENEVIASRDLGNYANGTTQKVQEIQKQYDHYIESGFKERWFDTRRGFMQRWHDTRSGLPSQRAGNTERDASQDGVWLTTLIVWAMQNPETTLFLDSWWYQNAFHTTQDQVSFPFVVWKTGLWPYTLPDSVVKRRPEPDHCDWFTALPHGQ